MKSTADQAVNKFFQSWKDQKWEEMFEVCQKTWGYTKTKEDLKEHFESPDWKLKDFNVAGFTNVSNVKRSFIVELSFADGRIERHTAIVICESAPYTPAAYGDWGVNPISVLKNFGTIKSRPKPKQKANESKK
ncbi:MAG: hypothetical protein PF690_17455 [Deltaproteobacteria bacterium]|jgi:hypothetical protein|nr:hypothetical protein [Deltaproteobacteria bacterium]